MNNTAVKQEQLDGPLDDITGSKVSHMFLSFFERSTVMSTDVGTGKGKQRKLGRSRFIPLMLRLCERYTTGNWFTIYGLERV